MTTTLPDPITNNQERVMVRNTATGFEQGVAAAAGLFTAGPIGALASWGAIRGLQGKWTPWFILGVPAAAAINVVNTVAVVSLVGAFGGFEGITDEVESLQEGYKEQSSLINEEAPEIKQAFTEQIAEQDCIFPNNNGFDTFSSCVVSKRVNVNGTEVHDIQLSGAKPVKIILWADNSAEYFDSNDRRIEGTYSYSPNYDNMVTFTPNGKFTVKNTNIPWHFSYKLPV